MMVFTYSDDGIIRHQDMDIDLDPNDPGCAYAVWRGMLIDTSREHLIEWALRIEENRRKLSEEWLEDNKKRLQTIKDRIAMLELAKPI